MKWTFESQKYLTSLRVIANICKNQWKHKLLCAKWIEHAGSSANIEIHILAHVCIMM